MPSSEALLDRQMTALPRAPGSNSPTQSITLTHAPPGARAGGYLDSYAKAVGQAIATGGDSAARAFAQAFADAQSAGGNSAQVGPGSDRVQAEEVAPAATPRAQLSVRRRGHGWQPIYA
jgi:hypothetical protein